MASNLIRSLYREARKAGYHPSHALYAARTLAKWKALDSVGGCRIREVADLYEEGVIVIGEYVRPDAEPIAGVLYADQDFVKADDVWGHVGYTDAADWRENANVIDIMAETIRAFRDAWKAHVADLSAAQAWAKIA